MNYEPVMVEAYVASWIEMDVSLLILTLQVVEAYVASWIEIIFLCALSQSISSRLT